MSCVTSSKPTNAYSMKRLLSCFLHQKIEIRKQSQFLTVPQLPTLYIGIEQNSKTALCKTKLVTYTLSDVLYLLLYMFGNPRAYIRPWPSVSDTLRCPLSETPRCRSIRKQEVYFLAHGVNLQLVSQGELLRRWLRMAITSNFYTF